MTETLEAGHKAPKMLIADDDPAIVRLLAERCAKMGFAVETATNGMQALIMARRSQPDILIVDLNMPELDGFSICARLLDPSSKPIEVVVVTGSSDPETIERCESLGAFYRHKGADFWSNMTAALAAVYPDMAERIEEQGLQSKVAKVRQRPRVLVVDDDPDIEAFLSSRLGKYGVDTLYASDALHGYRIACKEGVSLGQCGGKHLRWIMYREPRVIQRRSRCKLVRWQYPYRLGGNTSAVSVARFAASAMAPARSLATQP